MKRPQYIVLAIAVLLVGVLYFLAPTKQRKVENKIEAANTTFSPDSLLIAATNTLQADRASRVRQLENNLQSAKPEDSLNIYNQLVAFWHDTGKVFFPYAYYVAKQARLENSEKKLNFAAHLFLDEVQQTGREEEKKWFAFQAKDLFERSLMVNPNNDSTKIGLGATLLFGGISQMPMEGLSKIKEVVDKDSTNIYGQITLAIGAMMTGQLDKAEQRLKTVTHLDKQNIQALLMLGDVYEKKGDKKEAVVWYEKAMPLVKREDMKAELEKRIEELKK